MKLPWKKIWADFDKWCETVEEIHCNECHRLQTDFPEWADQQQKIEQLVRKAMK